MGGFLAALGGGLKKLGEFEAGKWKKDLLGQGHGGGNSSMDDGTQPTPGTMPPPTQVVGPGVIPSYDRGTALVPYDQLAAIHRGEAVVPAEQNPNNPEAQPMMMARNVKPGLFSQVQSLMSPLTSEVETLKTKTGAMDSGGIPQVMPDTHIHAGGGDATSPKDKINPQGKYGDKPGEVRPEQMKPQIFDKGGVVNSNKSEAIESPGPESLRPKGEGDDDIPLQRRLPLPDAAIKEAMNPQSGAPADFNGPVFPNPEGIRPMLDKESAPIRLTGGAKFSPTRIMTYDDGGTAGDDSGSFDQNQEHVPALLTPGETVRTPEQEAALHPPASPEIQADMHTVRQDAADAMQKGDLSKLGMAKINMKQLQSPEAMTDTGLPPVPKATQGMSAGTTQPASMRTDTGVPPVPAAGAVMTPQGGAPVPAAGAMMTPQAGVPKTHEELEARRAAFKDQILSGDPMASAEAQKQLLLLNKMNPWGSQANRPGILGKIGHGLAMAGNIAGNVFAAPEMSLIPGTQLYKQGQEAQAERGMMEAGMEKARAAETALKEQQAKFAGRGTTPAEQTFFDLMHGGPGGTPRVNPDTKIPYTTPEAQIASQGTGKTVDELAIQDVMKTVNPATGQNFTREAATIEVKQKEAGLKLSPTERAQKSWADAHKLDYNNPEVQVQARQAVVAMDTTAKNLAAMPMEEQKARFQNTLNEERDRLNQGNADAFQRGLKRDELDQTENARHNKVMSNVEFSKKALEAADSEQLSANMIPLLSTLAVVSIEGGVKRLNTLEMSKFDPSNGSFTRWAEGHADKFMAGQIPDEYKSDMSKMLDRMAATEDHLHDSNRKSVDTTLGQGSQRPVVTPSGATPKREKAENKQTVGHKTGDLIVQGGKTYKATAVDKDGKVTAAEPVK